MRRVALSLIAVAAAAGSAHATLFSFAANTSDSAWVFTGAGLNMTSGMGNSPVVLNIDDDNGPLPALFVSSRFSASITLSPVGTTPLPGAFAHNYTADGSFSFTDIASGTTLLTVTFENALYTSLGQQSSWGTTGALQATTAGGSSISMNWGGAALPQYGLLPGIFDGQDFNFGLTTLNTSGALPYTFQNPGVPITPATMIPTAPWFGESSFSASAVSAPAPAGLALLGLGGLLAARRRR